MQNLVGIRKERFGMPNAEESVRRLRRGGRLAKLADK